MPNPERFKRKPKEAVTLVLDGRELPTMQGRFAYGIDVLASSYNATIAWTPGKDPWLDKATARGSYADSELFIGPQLVCTGRLYGRENVIAKDGIKKTLEFYSMTADLVDSYIPPAEGEIRHSDLRQIAQLLCANNGFPVKFIDTPGDPFDVVEAKRDGVETVGKYLQRLAAQRGLFISSDERGGVVFQKAVSGGMPVARIEYPGRVANKFRAHFDDRKRFAKYFASSVTGDGIALNGTASDPSVPAARQILFEANDADAGNIQSAAEWRMLLIELEALSVDFPVSDWFDASGNLWKANSIVSVKSPVMDIPNESNFVVRKIEFAWSAEKRGAILNLVPPLLVEGGKLQVGR